MTSPRGSVRVLSLGGNNVFTARLYREVQRERPEFAFVVSDYQHLGNVSPANEDDVFAGHVRTRLDRVDRGTVMGALRACGQPQLYRRLWAATFFRGRPLTRDAIGHAVRSARLAADLGSLPPFAIWHVQFCTPSTLALADARPRGARLVCSFWGSDLLRARDGEAQWHVRRAVRQADAITVQSVELREIVLSLYGRDLFERVHVCRFLVNRELLDHLDRLPPGAEGRRHARVRADLPPDAHVIAIGNSGSPGNQHLRIVDQLAALPAALRERLFLVFPWAYGGSARESPETLTRAVQARGLRCRAEERFLGGEALAALRAAADVTIHVPISDALSHLVIEALYAGSRVVTGAWLPYGPYRRSGLAFEEVEDLTQLPAVIARVIAGGAPIEAELTEIRRRIRESTSDAVLLRPWLSMYRAVLGEDAARI